MLFNGSEGHVASDRMMSMPAALDPNLHLGGGEVVIPMHRAVGPMLISSSVANLTEIACQKFR